MKNFTYHRPTTVEQAVGLLENRFGNTELLAGGTDLLDLQKEYIAQPTRIVSLSAINGLAGIEVQQRAVKIGAGTRLAARVTSASTPPIATYVPACDADTSKSTVWMRPRRSHAPTAPIAIPAAAMPMAPPSTRRAMSNGRAPCAARIANSWRRRPTV